MPTFIESWVGGSVLFSGRTKKLILCSLQTTLAGYQCTVYTVHILDITSYTCSSGFFLFLYCMYCTVQQQQLMFCLILAPLLILSINCSNLKAGWDVKKKKREQRRKNETYMNCCTQNSKIRGTIRPASVSTKTLKVHNQLGPQKTLKVHNQLGPQKH